MAAPLTLKLPVAGGRIETYALRGTAPFAATAPATPFTRIAYSAAHVVADPLASVDPWLTAAIDWDATIAYRQRLWSLGLGVAEAMDTAQRGMGLDWPTSLELIRRSLDATSAPGTSRRAAAPITSTQPKRRASTTSSAPTRSRWPRSSATAAASS